MRHAVARHAVAVLLAVGVLAILAIPGQAQFTLYDDFSSGSIDPEKFSGSSLEGGFNSPSEEFVRMVDTGKLRLGLVSWGATASDSGTAQSRLGLSIRQLGTLGGSGFIIGLGAKVTVLDAEAQHCANNTTASQARAQLLGFFFNDGTGGVSSDVGNIIARIQLQKDNDGGNRISAFLSRCTNADCSSADVIVLAGNPTTFTKTWSPNTPLNLKMIWDQVNGKFKFKVTDPSTVTTETKNIVYLGTVTDAGPPTFNDTKQVRLQNFAENCIAARKRTFMDALFDNVKVERMP